MADRAAWSGATLLLKVFQAVTNLIGGDPEKVRDYLTGDPVRDSDIRTACETYTDFVHLYLELSRSEARPDTGTMGFPFPCYASMEAV
jgi:hypothetical protein